MTTYKESGVDIGLEELTISALTSNLKKTLKFRDIITESGHFAALVRLGDKAIAMSTDGVGSKILVAELLDKYDTVGIDCVAMVVNDLLCVGAEPMAMVDYLAVEKPDPEIAVQIGKGLADGAEQARVAMIGGETASLPEIVDNFDLAGTGIGIVDVDGIITGEDIQEGDILIGIASSGIHSNGLSLARRVIFQDAGLKVDSALPGFPDTTVGEELLKPTMIYVKPVVELLKSNVNIHGVAHITGGGFNNLKRLKKDAGYKLDNLPQPDPIFMSLHSLGVPLDEMYQVFNMGIGMVVIVPEEESQTTINIIEKYNQAYKIGEVQNRSGQVTIKTFKNSEIRL
ncbi:MAG TPA: phosphoribosylformylglycinamidine cyclo-ligase [Methanobacterium sp.]|nr:phosphoribosylformylglycinamidine cyclo-ligase [Methanobacterium sp.]